MSSNAMDLKYMFKGFASSVLSLKFLLNDNIYEENLQNGIVLSLIILKTK